MNARSSKKNIVASPEEIEHIVEKFSKLITKEMGPMIKSVVWFGSALRKSMAGKRSIREEILYGSDIDILIIFDDQINVVTPEVITAYRIITEKTAAKVSKRLHITTMQLTKFWDYSLKGDPILINMLRDGKAIFDSGTFNMAKNLLSSKLIKPVREIVWIYLGRGPLSVNNANYNVTQAMLDLYWAVFDVSHAAILRQGFVPDDPEYLVSIFKKHLVDTGIIQTKYLKSLSEFMNIGKMIMHGEVTKMKGDSFDRYKAEAKDFVKVCEETIFHHPHLR